MLKLNWGGGYSTHRRYFGRITEVDVNLSMPGLFHTDGVLLWCLELMLAQAEVLGPFVLNGTAGPVADIN